MNEKHKEALDTLCSAASCFAGDVGGGDTESEIRAAVELIESWTQAQPDTVELAVFFGGEMERQEFEFDTLGERGAFVRGLNAMDGWSRYVTASPDEEYEVVQQIGGSWENTWHLDDEMATYASYREARESLDDFFDTCDKANMAYNRDEYKIVPVGYF